MFGLIDNYVDRDFTGACNKAMLRQFFELYPRALTQTDRDAYAWGGTCLHLFAASDCETDLFKWVVEQHPSNMLKKNVLGHTPLHYACDYLVYGGSNEICKILIASCPKAARITFSNGDLPIHDLAKLLPSRPISSGSCHTFAPRVSRIFQLAWQDATQIGPVH